MAEALAKNSGLLKRAEEIVMHDLAKRGLIKAAKPDADPDNELSPIFNSRAPKADVPSLGGEKPGYFSSGWPAVAKTVGKVVGGTAGTAGLGYGGYLGLRAAGGAIPGTAAGLMGADKPPAITGKFKKPMLYGEPGTRMGPGFGPVASSKGEQLGYRVGKAVHDAPGKALNSLKAKLGPKNKGFDIPEALPAAPAAPVKPAAPGEFKDPFMQSEAPAYASPVEKNLHPTLMQPQEPPTPKAPTPRPHGMQGFDPEASAPAAPKAPVTAQPPAPTAQPKVYDPAELGATPIPARNVSELRAVKGTTPHAPNFSPKPAASTEGMTARQMRMMRGSRGAQTGGVPGELIPKGMNLAGKAWNAAQAPLAIAGAADAGFRIGENTLAPGTTAGDYYANTRAGQAAAKGSTNFLSNHPNVSSYLQSKGEVADAGRNALHAGVDTLNPGMNLATRYGALQGPKGWFGLKNLGQDIAHPGQLATAVGGAARGTWNAAKNFGSQLGNFGRASANDFGSEARAVGGAINDARAPAPAAPKPPLSRQLNAFNNKL